jgi:hypothetical protein
MVETRSIFDNKQKWEQRNQISPIFDITNQIFINCIIWTYIGKMIIHMRLFLRILNFVVFPDLHLFHGLMLMRLFMIE